MRCCVVRALVAQLVVLALLPLAAAATPIVPFSQSYSVWALVDPGPGDPLTSTRSSSTPGTLSAGGTVSHPTFPGFGASASITLTSQLTDSRIYVTWFGSNYRYGYGEAVDSEAHVDVVFDLTVPSSYTFWDLSVSPERQASISLTDSFGTQVSGLELPAGRYRLKIDAFGTRFQTSYPEGQISGFADLGFTPVPEPNTALLVALGLGALAPRRAR